jgi:hypothetical protein
MLIFKSLSSIVLPRESSNSFLKSKVAVNFIDGESISSGILISNSFEKRPYEIYKV